MNCDPAQDGKTHINIYSKGKTELGRLLTNFAHTPIDIAGLHCESLEAYWYYLGINFPVGVGLSSDMKRLLNSYGFQAKKVGKELRKKYGREEHYNFEGTIKSVMRMKVQQHPQIARLLRESTLPFAHYYTFSGVVRDAGYPWIVEEWEKIRDELKGGTKGMIEMVGITERGDAALDRSWSRWVLDGKPAILITKNPGSLASYLPNLGMKNPNVIVHCTITGFGGTRVEPNVPSPKEALEGYRELIDLLSAERVVLRVDPIIPTEKGFERAKQVVKSCAGTRIRISFLDNYPQVKERFRKANLPALPYRFHSDLSVRKKLHKELEELSGKSVEICGEPGMKCSGCISPRDCKILNVEPLPNKRRQRSFCLCLGNKKELLSQRGQCKHGCLYCYWK